MSTGTNKERLEQNNTLLEDIKTQIQNLPEAGGSGNIKQFATQEEMQADTTAKEGDLAIVYRNEVQNATVDSRFQTATFPETVVLDNAMTDYVNVRYRAVDSSKMFNCWGSLNSSGFNMNCNTETGGVRIQYTSSDGITYTRTDTTGNPVDFGTEIYYENAEMWNDAIGKFIQVGGSIFEGLYTYSDNSWSLAPTQLTAIADYVYGKEFYGQNGVETGTLQNKENLTSDEVKHRVNIWSNYSSGIICPSNASFMFNGCTNLTEIPLLDTSNVTNMCAMFSSCTNLTEIPLLNTSSVTDMNDMFDRCTNLTTIPLLDTGSVTDMEYMFYGCTNLTTMPLLNASNVTNMEYMFDSCTNLTTIPLLNTSNVTNMEYMFNGCTSLSDESLNNILAMCTNATSYTRTKTLKYIGLTSAQATKCTTLSNYSAFTAAGWATGY